MTVDKINVEDTIALVKGFLAEEKGLSPALKSALEVMLMLVAALLNRLTLNSNNSSKPPSSDPNRKRSPKQGKRQRGGQKGHAGTTLEPGDDPDVIEALQIDRASLPAGDYRVVGHEPRQVIDINISRFVIEYRAEILADQHGQRYTVALKIARFRRPVRRRAGLPHGCGA